MGNMLPPQGVIRFYRKNGYFISFVAERYPPFYCTGKVRLAAMH